MNTEEQNPCTEVATTTAASIVPTEGQNLELSASTPREMVESHQAMIGWCERKILVIQESARELRDAYEHAREKKWKSDVLKRHADLEDKRLIYYQKFKAALEAGYCVVPNFPVTMFAIRTNKNKPVTGYAYLTTSREKNFQQEPKLLEQGEGEYKNPNPVIIEETWNEREEQRGSYKAKTHPVWADAWDDLEFPANMARLHVMQAATRAMAMKIFDEIGFLPADVKRNPDPILIGRLIDPRPVGYGPKKTVSFMIAWHVDTSTL